VDEALYRYANQLFNEQFNQMVHDLSGCEAGPNHSQEQSNDPILLPALIQRYERADAQQSAFSTVLHRSMKHPSAGHHWHSREGLEDHCTAFRWTGPEATSTLHVPILKPDTVEQLDSSTASQDDSIQDYTIQIYVVRAIAPDVLESLSLTANSTLILLTVLTQWETNTVLQGTIPLNAIAQHPSLTPLTLTVNRTESMQAIAPQSADRRQVGVAISHVCVFPSGVISPEISTLRLFPRDDGQWLAVKTFIETHLKSNEAIAAPKEFLQLFPAQFQDITRLQLPLDENFAHPLNLHHPTWAIVAKHLAHEIPTPSLRWMMDTMQPVFSNPVFMVLSTRAELDPVPYFADDPWSEAADFLSANLQSGDRLAAPREFLFRVPIAHFLGDPIANCAPHDHPPSSSQANLREDIRPSDMIRTANWVVIHKGFIRQCSDEVLDHVVAELRPVFANLVFVIFSRQTAQRRLPFWNRDLRAFWKVYLRRQWFRAIQWVTQRPNF